ncbi:GNAT family N-acetyltransferase [Fictibacillus sp. 18YEL24]|uniref:GNAT family N-acetyltransferase n=1 Tax=Fictibacillus sp. 18YEL24 TaxID=2745875 RepID=UPI0018CDB209|nr:GNAT family N-acetyltransferase [Fictibacillus sp. 18YEL24]MBH0169948.1 GNAT family N-acetyltransferase [Fictibacillus sp. 18YEL24]
MKKSRTTEDITLMKAGPDEVKGIARVCSEGWRATYGYLEDESYVNSVIEEYYNEKRIENEVTEFSENWHGYFVAKEDGEVAGAIGGGTIGEEIGEIFVFYMDPNKRNRGIGSKLLNYYTDYQKNIGIKEQWLSAQKGNEKAIPFYEAKGFIKQSEKISESSKTHVSIRYMRHIE